VEGLEVEAGKVAEFATALRDDNPIHHDPAAATEREFDAVPAPLTFTRTSYFPRYRPEGISGIQGFDLGFDEQYTVHGEQAYEYERPLVVGDVLTGDTTVLDAFERDGIDSDKLEFQPAIRVQYTGMLDDLEVQIEEFWDGNLDGENIEQIIEKFEDEFGRVFQRAARSPENGYQFTVAIGTGVAPSQKPALPDEKPVSTDTPPEQASKGERAIYWEGDWHDASIWDMNHIQAGNVVEGPAVTEAPATTMLVPPGWEASLDNNRIYHLTPPNQ
jgi:acyl dehydratase